MNNHILKELNIDINTFIKYPKYNTIYKNNILRNLGIGLLELLIKSVNGNVCIGEEELFFYNIDGEVYISDKHINILKNSCKSNAVQIFGVQRWIEGVGDNSGHALSLITVNNGEIFMLIDPWGNCKDKYIIQVENKLKKILGDNIFKGMDCIYTGAQIISRDGFCFMWSIINMYLTSKYGIDVFPILSNLGEFENTRYFITGAINWVYDTLITMKGFEELLPNLNNFVAPKNSVFPDTILFQRSIGSRDFNKALKILDIQVKSVKCDIITRMYNIGALNINSMEYVQKYYRSKDYTVGRGYILQLMDLIIKNRADISTPLNIYGLMSFCEKHGFNDFILYFTSTKFLV
jgi:hypothetical protein